MPFRMEIDLKNTDSVAHTVNINLIGTLASSTPLWDLSSRVDISPSQYSHSFGAGEAATAVFEVTCHWKWIDPEFIDAPSIASTLAARLSVAAIGSMVADSLLFGNELAELSIAKPWLTLTMTSTLDRNLSFPAQTIQVCVPQFNLVMLGISVIASLVSLGMDVTAAAHLIVALAAAFPSGGVSLLVPASEFIVGLMLYALSVEAYYFAQGDPDQDYKTIVTPLNYSFPEIASMNDTWARNQAAEALSVYSYFNASLVSLGRFYGAAQAGDYDFMVKQLQAATSYMDTAKHSIYAIVDRELSRFPDLSANETTVNQGKAVLTQNGLPDVSKKIADQVVSPKTSESYVKAFATATSGILTDPKTLLESSNAVFAQFDNATHQEIDTIQSARSRNQLFQIDLANPMVLARFAAIFSMAVLVVLFVSRKKRLPKGPLAQPVRELGKEVCPNCKSVVVEQEEFCSVCGQRLREGL